MLFANLIQNTRKDLKKKRELMDIMMREKYNFDKMKN